MTPSTTTESHHRNVLIIGAGLSGILQACTLLRRRLSHADFAILDRYDAFGGCWLKNTYPGCACDTPSAMYSVSWYRNPNWSRIFAPQPEILAYYQRLAADHELAQSANFGVNVVSATWSDESLTWTVRTSLTATSEPGPVWTCTYLITALGPFSVTKTLSLPGLSSFTGRIFHTSSWPANTGAEALRGSRVAIIGTGPSAGQIIPATRKEFEHLTVYQRSAGHVWPRHDGETSALRRWVFAAIPGVLAAYVTVLLWLQESVFWRMCKARGWLQARAMNVAIQHLESQVADPELREKLRPKDAFGCKRPLFLDDYYPALAQGNVNVITDTVVRITPTGVISQCPKTGIESESIVDTIIWGTGYHVTGPGSGFPIYGRDGVKLDEEFERTEACLYGVAHSKFPSYGTFIGPYSVGIWFSIVLTIEAQAEWHAMVSERLIKLNSGGGRKRRAVVPKAEREVEWTNSIRAAQGELATSMAGCVTYYKKENGTVVAYPGHPKEYRGLLEKLKWEKDWDMLEVEEDGDGKVKIGKVLETDDQEEGKKVV